MISTNDRSSTRGVQSGTEPSSGAMRMLEFYVPPATVTNWDFVLHDHETARPPDDRGATRPSLPRRDTSASPTGSGRPLALTAGSTHSGMTFGTRYARPKPWAWRGGPSAARECVRGVESARDRAHGRRRRPLGGRGGASRCRGRLPGSEASVQRVAPAPIEVGRGTPSGGRRGQPRASPTSAKVRRKGPPCDLPRNRLFIVLEYRTRSGIAGPDDATSRTAHHGAPVREPKTKPPLRHLMFGLVRRG